MTSIDAIAIHRPKAGVKGQKKGKPKIDMTPMVDLGFLLISFFVITAQLSEPRSARLTMPKEGRAMTLSNSSAMTVILGGKDRIYYYQGNWEDALKRNDIIKTDFSSTILGNAIIQQRGLLDANGKKKDDLMLLIKSTGDASYRNIIDILDEVLINDVKKYAIVKTEPAELTWIKEQI